jgi:hypothetical protein
MYFPNKKSQTITKQKINADFVVTFTIAVTVVFNFNAPFALSAKSWLLGPLSFRIK